MTSPNNQDPDSLKSSSHFVAYTGAVADTDLVLEGKAPCRAIRAIVGGFVVVKRASDKASVILPIAAGETLQVCATDLVSASSTATGITVYW